MLFSSVAHCHLGLGKRIPHQLYARAREDPGRVAKTGGDCMHVLRAGSHMDSPVGIHQASSRSSRRMGCPEDAASHSCWESLTSQWVTVN